MFKPLHQHNTQVLWAGLTCILHCDGLGLTVMRQQAVSSLDSQRVMPTAALALTCVQRAGGCMHLRCLLLQV